MTISDNLSPSPGNNSILSVNTTKDVCVALDLYKTFFEVWNLYISFGCFVVGLPPAIIFCCNIVTLVALRRQWDAEYNSKNRSNYRTSVSFTYLIIIIGIINCISTIPVGYLYIQYDYFNVRSSPVFYRVALLLFYVNSGTNVIVYCLVGKAFRQDLKQLLKSFCKRCRTESPECVTI